MKLLNVSVAGPDDAPDLALLICAMFREWEADPPVGVKTLEECIEAAVARETGRMEALIARRDREAIGFAAFGEVYEPAFLGSGCFLRDIFVLPGYRRRGVGSGLMGALYREAAARSWVSIDWHVNRLDFDARTFFEMQAPDGYSVDRLVHRIDGEALKRTCADRLKE